MSGIGHNGGPGMGGTGWQLHCWKEARKGLLGERLPIEVIRTRVKRAEALGLPYRTYASVRAATGRDLIGFLFSSHALRAFPDSPAMPDDRAAMLAAADATRAALTHAPLTPDALLAANPGLLENAGLAPDLTHGWSATRTRLATVRGRIPPDALLLIGDTALEADWALAGKLAGYLPAERYFTTA